MLNSSKVMKKQIDKKVEKIVKEKSKLQTSSQLKEVNRTTNSSQQRTNETGSKDVKKVQDSNTSLKRKTIAAETKVPDKIRKTGTENAREPLIVRIPKAALEKPVKQLLEESKAYHESGSRTEELDQLNNVRLQVVSKRQFEMFDEAFCHKWMNLTCGTVDSLVSEWKDKAAKERADKLKDEERRRKRLADQQRQVEIPDTINLDQLDSSSADDATAEQLPPVSFEPINTPEKHSSETSNVSEFLESGSGDEDSIQIKRYQSPLLAPLQNGWHRKVKEEKKQGAKGFEDSPYYYHDDNKEKHYYGDEPDLLEAIRKTGFSIGNFFFRNSVDSVNWRHYARSTDHSRIYFKVPDELQKVQSLDEFKKHANGLLNAISDTMEAKATTELKEVMKKFKFELYEGIHGDYDCSNGNEGAFVLYATLALAERFKDCKDRFYFPIEGKAYEIPEVNQKYREENRPCCTCTDGCISVNCECKVATREFFHTANPDFKHINLDHGWYKNGRLNLRLGEQHEKKLTTLAALQSREVKIYECSDRCQCKRKNCSNSVISDKIRFPMMMVSREVLKKDARKPPTVYALCKVPPGSFLGATGIRDIYRNDAHFHLPSVMAAGCQAELRMTQKRLRDIEKTLPDETVIMMQVNGPQSTWQNCFFNLGVLGHPWNRDPSKKSPYRSSRLMFFNSTPDHLRPDH